MLNKPGQNILRDDNYFLVFAFGSVIAYCSRFQLYFNFV